MRFVVFGAGAIGCTLAAELFLAKQQVGIIARGEHLAQIRKEGLLFTSMKGERHRLDLEAGTEIAPGDVVLVTLKSYALVEAAAAIRRATREDGIVVFLQNGLPWWYFRDLEGPHRDRRLATLDAHGQLHANFDQRPIAGGVVTMASTLSGPGRVEHTAARGVSVGRPDGREDARLAALGDALALAGFEVSLPGDPRPAIWIKLVVNVALNGVAALTGATIGEIWDDDDLRPLVHQLAGETQRIAAALGCPVELDLEQRRRNAARTHKSSTLQDIEAGRLIEHEALFGALLPLADELRIAVPHIRTVSALLRRRALQLGCLPMYGT
jgi:2-dehydropantoate 2-reductase